MIMKKKILIGIGVAFLLFVIWVVYGLFIATPVSPPTTASYNEGGLEIAVAYSQPSKKGRLIFGEDELVRCNPMVNTGGWVRMQLQKSLLTRMSFLVVSQ
jgi:hypothetical protein